jgi:hypothetical protein
MLIAWLLIALFCRRHSEKLGEAVEDSMIEIGRDSFGMLYNNSGFVIAWFDPLGDLYAEKFEEIDFWAGDHSEPSNL